MASNVVVLAPNGRRQNVKVTPNTTILQILEEVCKKQGLKPEEFDVKHHNKVLDISSIIRFSGLPNNAQLELCALQKARSECEVILGLQLENGERLTGHFVPSCNLWQILSNLCPEEITVGKSPVIIYMRQEIYGDSLKSTSLKSLGLMSGRAMFRLVQRKPEELRTQANVSAPLPSKPQEERPEKSYVRKIQKIENEPEPIRNAQHTEKFEERRTSTSKRETNYVTEFVKREKARKTNDASKIKSSKLADSTDEKKSSEPEDLAFLGSRSALAFSLDMAQTVPHEELPDEFFELTIKDARKLLRDLKQKRVELEENPLRTNALRSFEEDKKKLRTLNQHKKSILRVQFPDRTVLQGSFKPLETIQHVKDFVKEYLEVPTDAFHLYTTPPKNILNPEMSLLDAKCVPSAVVHFSLDSPVENNIKFLKHSLFSKFTSHSMASLAAARSRGSKPKQPEEENDDVSMEVDEIQLTQQNYDDVNVGASTSHDPGYPNISNSPINTNTTKEKVPKWFKSMTK